MAILDLTAVDAVAKVQYTQTKVNNMVYPESPVYAKFKKKNTFYGKTKHVAFKYGSPQGRGAAFSVGLANMGTTSYAAVDVGRKKEYVFAQLDGETIASCQNDAGALLNVVKEEFDGAFYTMGRSLAIGLFQAGGGARGKVGAISTNTFTLSDINQIVNFEKNMVLNFGTTDGTSGAKLAGTLTVTGVNRNTGVVTCSANITTGIALAAVGNWVFQNGDFESTKSLPTGIPGWIPRTDPIAGDNFFGLDRSADPTRLAGLRVTAFSGGPIEETLIQAAARIKREGGKPDLVAMNPLDIANLVTALGSKVIYDRSGSVDNPEFGFQTPMLMGPSGPMKIVPEIGVETGDAWMLTTSVWSFETAGGGPKILDEDGNTMRADPNSDSYIARIGYYGNYICEAPAWNAYVKL
jgi:hypothetical protein